MIKVSKAHEMPGMRNVFVKLNWAETKGIFKDIIFCHMFWGPINSPQPRSKVFVYWTAVFNVGEFKKAVERKGIDHMWVEKRCERVYIFIVYNDVLCMLK